MSDHSTETRVPACRCPLCGALLVAASSLDEGGGPAPGDLSVCINCASALVFEEGLQLRALAPAEFSALERAVRNKLRRYQRSVRNIDRRAT